MCAMPHLMLDPLRRPRPAPLRAPRRGAGPTSGPGRRGGAGAGRVELVRNGRPRVVRNQVLLVAPHPVARDVHTPPGDGHVPVDDELPPLPGGGREARLDVGREDVVERRALQREDPGPSQPAHELLPLPLRLHVARADQRLEDPGALTEVREEGLGPPQLLLVLEAVLLEDLVLRLDALALPRVGGTVVFLPRELRIAQALTPSSAPSS